MTSEVITAWHDFDLDQHKEKIQQACFLCKADEAWILQWHGGTLHGEWSRFECCGCGETWWMKESEMKAQEKTYEQSHNARNVRDYRAS